MNYYPNVMYIYIVIELNKDIIKNIVRLLPVTVENSGRSVINWLFCLTSFCNSVGLH